MSWLDTFSLAFRNLGQARLRTFLTVLGVSIGIAMLSGMVSFGEGLQEQLVGRFTKSGMFDAITVTSGPLPGRLGGVGRGRGRGAPGSSSKKLDDAAIKAIEALPYVKAVYPSIRVPVQIRIDDNTEGALAGGVPMSARDEGAFQSMSYGSFFVNEQAPACMVSLDMAKRLTELDPKTLIGRDLTVSYAARVREGAPSSPTTTEMNVGGVQINRVEFKCAIVGIVERETGPGIGGMASVSALMLPMPKAIAIDADQLRNQQSIVQGGDEERAYQSLNVKVSSAQRTQDVEGKIKSLGYSAFSLNDMLQGAKRAFIILDLFLALIGSIALAVSSLGIVNTMVMSILERTREIGIMKAIGGSDADVRKIFLIEASVIGVVGGVLGVLLGWLVGRVVNFGANIYIERQGGTAGELFSLPFWLIASAVGFSVLVSLLAGSYPARRAARLDPIQALRHD